MNPEGWICIFAKPPRPGEVKTRLVPAVGADGAAALAEAFILDTWAAVRSLAWAHPVVAATEPLPTSLGLGGAEVWLQGEGDLGERLERILRKGLDHSGFAIALGADSPGLPRSRLESARMALCDVDAVVGPCEDGGFYLLGVRRCPMGLLADVRWSEDDTFEQVVARLKGGGMEVRILAPWFDVDRPEDLVRLRERQQSGELDAPQTRAAMERMPSPGVSAAAAISVIIPVLNEQEYLPATLDSLRHRAWVREIIAVDGGSTDGTREWLAQQEGVRTLDVARGRGRQMNAGARAARGDVLLFLHADCLPAADASERIFQALAQNETAGGCFQVRFPGNRSAQLRFVAAGINLRTRLCRTGTGDQALFVRRELFDAIGGFRDWPLFEDVDLVRRLKKRGTFCVFPSASPVVISPRRYLRHGPFLTALLFHGLRMAFWFGVSPFTLDRWLNGGGAAQQAKVAAGLPLDERKRTAPHSSSRKSTISGS